MKKQRRIISFLVFSVICLLSFVSAGETITINVENGDMGAVVRVLHPTSESLIETAKMKNYNTGVITGTYESTRSEVIFKILVTERGSVVDSWQSEPLPTNTAHEFDLRSSAEEVLVVEKEEGVVEEPQVEESATEDEASEGQAEGAAQESNQEEETSGTANDEPAQEVEETSDAADEPIAVTGNAVQNSPEVSVASRWYVVAGILAILALFTLTGVFLHKKKQASPKEVTTIKQSELVEKSSEEKELEALEKKMKENESRIKQIKKKDETRKRIAQAKQRLAEEENQIQELEKDDQ